MIFGELFYPIADCLIVMVREMVANGHDWN